MALPGRPAEHPAIPARRIGVLLVNLGTPEAAEPGAVRRYLAEFLSDRRVVELSPLLWQPILRGAVLTTRPAKSAHAYRQVWGEGGSPLARITAVQAIKLQQRLGAGAGAGEGEGEGGAILVRYAMRYGEPALGRTLAQMKAAGCERILLAPLYPQYCAATTATAVDEAARALARMRWQPSLRSLPPYYDDPAYIEALALSVEEQLHALGWQPDVLLASFHGMPLRTLLLGDPYHCQCVATARLLAERLGRPVELSFQSRFGRARWLEPATDAVLAAMPARGVRSVAIVAPGFSADCVETLEELAIRGQETFGAAGGERFAVLACLNDSEPGMAMLETLVRRELMGWA